MVAILMKLIDVKITVFIFCLLCCTCFRCLKWWSKFPIFPSYIIYKNKCKIYINFWKEYLLIEWFVKDWIQKQDLRVETDSHKLVSYIKLRPRPVLLPKILTFSFFFSNPLLILKLLFRTVQKKMDISKPSDHFLNFLLSSSICLGIYFYSFGVFCNLQGYFP